MENKRRMPPPGGRPSFDKNTAARLGRYFLDYKGRMLFVVICIGLSAYAGVQGSLFLRTLIDDNITPLLSAAQLDFSGLLSAIFKMACIYAVGVVSIPIPTAMS